MFGWRLRADSQDAVATVSVIRSRDDLQAEIAANLGLWPFDDSERIEI